MDPLQAFSLQKLPQQHIATTTKTLSSSQTQIPPHQHDATPTMSSSSTMPLSSDPPFLCADEAAIVGLLDVEPHHMPEKDYLRRCRDHSINVTAVGKGSAFAPGLFAVKVVSPKNS
ncbi:hypothetical protein JHK85_006581 [Glycine max]|nr:hypothetical protein JHK85_006581 [Glycine max]